MRRLKHDLTALEYRALAEAAAKTAEACELTLARQQHEIAAARWLLLAEAEERRAIESRARLAAGAELIKQRFEAALSKAAETATLKASG